MRGLARRALAALAALCLLGPGAAAQSGVHVLLDNGPTSERLNVVVVAEGYREEEEALFLADAQARLDDLLSVPPYSAYAAAFNGFAIPTVSAESGADHPSRGSFRDTYLDAYYDCGQIQRLICLGTQGYGRVGALLVEHVPEYDIVLISVNDPEYGGSGGAYAVTSVHPAAPEVAIHEIGHSFGNLSDEYGGTGAGFESVNTTSETQRDQIRWQYWIDPLTPVPTPVGGVSPGEVGLFEGAAYADQGCYRPQLDCKMRSLGVAFCAVCTEHQIGAIYDLLPPILSRAPAEADVDVAEGASVQFSLGLLTPQAYRSVTWRVGGVPVEGADGPDLVLLADDLPLGETVVSATVADLNAAVRAPELLPLLRDSTAWTVRRSGVVAREGLGPAASALGDAHPNPTPGAVTFSFRLATAGAVRLAVYDVTGRRVATVADGIWPPGEHALEWDASRLPGGVYVYRLDAPGVADARRLTVVR